MKLYTMKSCGNGRLVAACKAMLCICLLVMGAEAFPGFSLEAEPDRKHGPLHKDDPAAELKLGYYSTVKKVPVATPSFILSEGDESNSFHSRFGHYGSLYGKNVNSMGTPVTVCPDGITPIMTQVRIPRLAAVEHQSTYTLKGKRNQQLTRRDSVSPKVTKIYKYRKKKKVRKVKCSDNVLTKRSNLEENEPDLHNSNVSMRENENINACTGLAMDRSGPNELTTRYVYDLTELYKDGREKEPALIEDTNSQSSFTSHEDENNPSFTEELRHLVPKNISKRFLFRHKSQKKGNNKFVTGSKASVSSAGSIATTQHTTELSAESETYSTPEDNIDVPDLIARSKRLEYEAKNASENVNVTGFEVTNPLELNTNEVSKPNSVYHFSEDGTIPTFTKAMDYNYSQKLYTQPLFKHTENYQDKQITANELVNASHFNVMTATDLANTYSSGQEETNPNFNTNIYGIDHLEVSKRSDFWEMSQLQDNMKSGDKFTGGLDLKMLEEIGTNSADNVRSDVNNLSLKTNINDRAHSRDNQIEDSMVRGNNSTEKSSPNGLKEKEYEQSYRSNNNNNMDLPAPVRNIDCQPIHGHILYPQSGLPIHSKTQDDTVTETLNSVGLKSRDLTTQRGFPYHERNSANSINIKETINQQFDVTLANQITGRSCTEKSDSNYKLGTVFQYENTSLKHGMNHTKHNYTDNKQVEDQDFYRQKDISHLNELPGSLVTEESITVPKHLLSDTILIGQINGYNGTISSLDGFSQNLIENTDTRKNNFEVKSGNNVLFDSSKSKDLDLESRVEKAMSVLLNETKGNIPIQSAPKDEVPKENNYFSITERGSGIYSSYHPGGYGTREVHTFCEIP